MTFNLSIQGVQGDRYFAPDVVPQAVSDAYNAEIENFLDIYNSLITGSTQISNPNGPNYVDPTTLFSQLLDARTTLIDYASNGIPLAGVGNVATTGYLNRNMARAMDTLIKMLDIAGITPATTGAAAQTQAVQSWMNLSVAGLGDYLSQAAQAGQTGRSIQAMIQLEYIKAGNDLITAKLGGLEEALSLTQSAVNLLTSIQNLHNKVTPLEAPDGNFNVGIFGPTTDENNYVRRYKNYGDQYYNNPIGVSASYSPTDLAKFTQIVAPPVGTTSPLLSLISSLLAVTFPNAGGIAGAFNPSTGQPIDSSLDGSLSASLYQVYFDMSKPTGVDKPPTGTANLLQKWIVDNMGTPATQGLYSINITTAITSAQSLNDQQKQSIQQTLFLFQEFYQSGSGMLTQINQIITAMAQACAR